jgi:hypothetical protein
MDDARWMAGMDDARWTAGMGPEWLRRLTNANRCTRNRAAEAAPTMQPSPSQYVPESFSELLSEMVPLSPAALSTPRHFGVERDGDRDGDRRIDREGDCSFDRAGDGSRRDAEPGNTWESCA